MYERLKEQVCKANIALVEHGLVVLTWGNVSQIDRQTGLVAIKPSGVDYKDLTPEKIVVLDLNGRHIDGRLRPSSDTPTHLELYRSFPGIGGICHTHSRYATIWAQACKDIPCLGTTHADHFYGPIPCTSPMDRQAIEGDYELNTGKAIVRRFAGIEPMTMPAVLVANHGPFTWGKDAFDAVANAIVLEEVAAMALGVEQLSPSHPPIDKALLDRHFLRKHGSKAYYGQR